jgi:hypothetical protein
MKRLSPIIELPEHHMGAMNLLSKYNFRITDTEFSRHSNGFLSVTVNWTADDPMFKYGVLGCKTYGWSDVSVEIEFPSAKYRWRTGAAGCRFISPVRLIVGVQRLHPKKEIQSTGKLGYEPLFFRNLKWGVEVWFAPRNWEKYDTRKVISSERFE